jgi:hypothetical protein
MAKPNPAVSGKGLLYVTSRIQRTDVLDEETYFKWYDEDHIDEIVHTSGMKSAFRYRDVDFDEKSRKQEKVFLAFYPMDDLAFTQGDEFRSIRVKSDILPDTGIIYDLADLDVRYLGLVEKTKPKIQRKSSAPCIVVFGVEPGPDSSDAEVEKWFREEVSRIPPLFRILLSFRSIFLRQPYSKATSGRHFITFNMPAPTLSQEP